MSKTKKANNQPSKYQELNDFELEIVCGGTQVKCNAGLPYVQKLPEIKTAQA